MDEWAAFLKARLDEDEAQLEESEGYRGPACALPGLHLDPDRARREIWAGRDLLAAYEASVRSVGEGLSGSLRRLVLVRAAVWSDHPDYPGARKSARSS